MEITISRIPSGFIGKAISNSGFVLLSITASTWFDAWYRLARVLSLLRVRYSLKFQF